MPTNTFEKLPDNKKNRIIDAAKKEFSRVPIDEVSIKNIVEEASIARGSFYQYFNSKEELLSCIIERDWNMIEFIKREIQKEKIDIFGFYINSYDYLSKKIRNKQNMEFYKKVFENIKVSDTKYEIFNHNNKKVIDTFIKNDFLKKIDTSKLNIATENEIFSLARILFLITRASFAFCFIEKNERNMRDEYIKSINMLKYGVYKKREDMTND